MLKKLSLVLSLLFFPVTVYAHNWVEKVAIPPEALERFGGAQALKERFLKHAQGEGVEQAYPEEVTREVQQFVENGIDFEGLEDLRHLPFVTIDNDYSKDLDQAIAIERLQNNKGYVIHYAIADASYFVKPGSALDKWAAERIFTTYLPSLNIPVLPRALSEDLCSLIPNKPRRAIVVSIYLDRTGQKLRAEFRHAVIESRKQLSYRLVQEFIDHPEKSQIIGQKYAKSLHLMQEVGELLVDRAFKRGVVVFPEGELRFRSVSAEEFYVGLYRRYPVEFWNEQVSVLVNQSVAQHIADQGYMSVHRHHPSPSGYKMGDLRKKLKALGRPWNHRTEKLGAFMHRLAESQAEGLDKNLLVSNSYYDRAAENLVCRTNFTAEYSALKKGHSGLKQDDYDHFTAPMRRYTDILVHSILHAIIKGQAVPYQDNEGPEYLRLSYMTEIAERANEASQREKRIERKNENFIASLVFASHLNEPLEGFIEYLNDKGLSVKIVDYPFRFWIKKEELDVFGSHQIGKDMISYVGPKQALRLGDSIAVRLSVSESDSTLKALPNSY